MNSFKQWSATVLYLLLAALAVALTGNAVSSAMIRLKTGDALIPSIVLPVILILSVSIVLIVLASITAVFSSLNLSNKTHSLGLPQGSVRAVIALSLIFIFIVTAIYLFGEVDGETGTYENITQAQLDAIPFDELIKIEAKEMNGAVVYDVTRRVEITDAGKEMAIQILTTVSTLVVAVAGFYFGTKSVAVARRVPVPEAPILFNDISPQRETSGKTVEIKVKGRHLGSVYLAQLELNGNKLAEPVVTNVQPDSENQIKCTFNLTTKDGNPIEAGQWDLVVEDKDGNQARLPEAFTVEAPAETNEE